MAKVTIGPGGKGLIALVGLGLVGFAAWRWKDKIAPDRPAQGVVTSANFPSGASAPSASASATPSGATATAALPSGALPSPGGTAPANRDLNRPLRVAINTWGGYAGGILANNGFRPNRESLFFRNYGIEVELVLIDDFPQSRAAFRTGGDSGGVDVMWATVDSYALEYPALEAQYHPVAFMQFDFSHGGDAIAVGPNIRSAADLRGKRIAYAEGTPSHYFLLYVLTQAGLRNTDITPVTVASAIEAANVFRAGSVDACVSWAPDVFNAARQRQGGRILTSTTQATNLIADMFYTRRDFLNAHTDTISRFVAGWMEGQREARANPDQAARIMASSFTGVSLEDAQGMLANAELTDYWANRRFFEMEGDIPVGFDDIFQSASGLWRNVGMLTQVGQAFNARDTRILQAIEQRMGARPTEAAAAAQTVGGTFTAPPPAQQQAVVSRRITIYFPTGSAELDPNAQYALGQVAELAATFGGAQMRVAGNTDNTGNRQTNIDLSRRRAQAVADFLVSRYHFDRNKFVVVGNGPDAPVGPNNTEAGRAQNRRTDFEILAPTTP